MKNGLIKIGVIGVILLLNCCVTREYVINHTPVSAADQYPRTAPVLFPRQRHPYPTYNPYYYPPASQYYQNPYVHSPYRNNYYDNDYYYVQPPELSTTGGIKNL